MFRSSNTQGQDNNQGKKGRRAIYTTCIALGLLGATGFAAATWSTNSSPWAHGATATAAHPSASAVIVGDLYPGDCNDVQVTVSNPNPHAVTLTGLNNTGFRNVSDTAASAEGNANRLEDFLYQADVSTALNGKVVNSGATRTFTVPNAVCLKSTADDARQGKSYEAGYFVAYQLNPGTEAN